jgi:membrane glycosyltransferase
VAGVGTVSIALAFWSKGYSSFTNHESTQAPNGLFSVHYLWRSWANSGVFDWKMLAILLPLPILGVVLLWSRPAELVALAGTVLVTAALYGTYYITALHPRFLLVALPPLFVLTAAGVAWITRDALAREPRAP